MNFHILTLFPEMIEQGLNTSITGRAISNGLLSIEAVNIRDYAFNKHQSVDDYPYGGGAGMLMQAEPVYLAYEAVRKKIAERKPAEAETETEEPAEAEQLEEKPVTGSEEEPVKEKKLRVVYLSPQGDVFSQGMAEELAKEEDLVLLCGHYEGIDERGTGRNRDGLCIDWRLCADGRRTAGDGNGRCDFQISTGRAS